jgi:hypothetical protein
MVSTIQNFLTLVITFTTFGLGYSALYIGYWFAGMTQYFKDNISGTDKIMQSFVIGGLSLIITLYSSDLGLIQSVDLSKLSTLLWEYSFVWIASTMSITAILLNHKSSEESSQN